MSPHSDILFSTITSANASLPVESFLPGMRNVSGGTSSSSSSSIPEDVLFKQNVQRYAYGYLTLAVCVSGLLGNLLAFLVLSRKTMRCSNTATYLRSLALVDGCVLLLAVFRYRSYYVLLSEREVIRVIVNFDRYVQVYVVPFFWISLGLSSYITLSLSLERVHAMCNVSSIPTTKLTFSSESWYLVVRWPFTLRKSRWVTVVRGVLVVAMVAICLVTLPVLLCYKMKRTTFRSLQVAAVIVSDRYLDARAYLYAYNHYVIPVGWYIGPWVIVAVVNTLLLWQVHKSSRIRVGVPNSLNPNRNLSLLIVLIVGVYMLCNLPRCVLMTYCLVDHCRSNNDGEDVNTRSFLLFKVTADVLNVLNSCLNIVVYGFSGSKFRRKIKGLLLCRGWCGKAVTPTTRQSLHVSLREVPATPLDCPKSFNVSFKELQLPHLPGLLPDHHHLSCADLQPMTLCTSCPLSSLHDVTPSPAASSSLSSSASSSSSSKVFRYDDLTAHHKTSTTLFRQLQPGKPHSFDNDTVLVVQNAKAVVPSEVGSDKEDPKFLAAASVNQVLGRDMM